MARRTEGDGGRIPRARRQPRRGGAVTRAEYNRIVKLLNERTGALDSLAEAVSALQHTSAIQFKRIAQLQAEIDALRRVPSKK